MLSSIKKSSSENIFVTYSPSKLFLFVISLIAIIALISNPVQAGDTGDDPVCVNAPYPEGPPEGTASLQITIDQGFAQGRMTFWRMPCDENNANILVRLEPLSGYGINLTGDLIMIQNGKQHYVRTEMDDGKTHCASTLYIPVTCRLIGRSGFDDDKAFTLIKPFDPETRIEFPAYSGNGIITDNLSKSDQIFNWAENNYPEFFSPSGAQTFEIDGYFARYYSDTNTYLGTKDGSVYVYGDQFNGLLNVGSISYFLSFIE